MKQLPMTARDAAKFAFDWPLIAFVKPVCNRCGRPIANSKVIDHLDAEHPGWLSEWNTALADAGLTEWSG